MSRNSIFLLFLTISPVLVLADGKPKKSWNNLYIIFIYIGFFTIAILISRIISRYRSFAFGANTGDQLPVRAARGLDTEDIESLPSLRFSEIKMHKVAEAGQLECSVCLNEFKDQEILRLLPDCLHVFHPDCIAPWLSSHVTCPVCRTSVDHRRGSSVSTSSILERVSGTYSERLDGISGILSSDMYDLEDDRVDNESITVEIEDGGKLEFSEMGLDGTRGGRRLVRRYSTGDLAVRIVGEKSRSGNNSGSSSSRVSSRKNENNEKSPKLVQLSSISFKSDSFVDYSSLLFVHAKSNI